MSFFKSSFKISTRSKGPADPKTYCLNCDPEKFEFCECCSDKKGDETESLISESDKKADMTNKKESANLSFDDFEDFHLTLKEADVQKRIETEQNKPVFTFGACGGKDDNENDLAKVKFRGKKH